MLFLSTTPFEALVRNEKAGLIKSLSAIAKHYGSEWTESGIEHHFRPLKKGALALRDLVAQGKDTKDHDVHSVS